MNKHVKNKYVRFLLGLPDDPDDASFFDKYFAWDMAVVTPIIFLLALIVLIFSVSTQSSNSFLTALDSFQNVNRIVIYYDSEVFEINDLDYNFNELKGLLDPRSEFAYHSFQTDMSDIAAYIEIDYFVGNRRVFSAHIYKLPQGFVLDEIDRFVVNSRRFAVSGQRGILLIDNYNRNVFARPFTNTTRLSSFGSVEFDVEKMLEHLN